MEETRQYYYGHPDGGRLDVDGVEWFKTDGYEDWYRWNNGELITELPNFPEEVKPKETAVEPEEVCFYKVRWALGGYKHYNTWEEARNAKHPKPSRAEIDEPARIDRITVVMLDKKAEGRVQQRRLDRIDAAAQARKADTKKA